MGRAVSYALDNWEHLTVFLSDIRVPVDNNASERALRIVAVYVPLCALSSSTWNHERAIVAGNTTRTTRPLPAAA
jgi:hypothetical protein